VQLLLAEEIRKGKTLVEEEDVLEPLAAAPKVDSQGEMTPPSCPQSPKMMRKWTRMAPTGLCSKAT
jgi:hypothetical protein